MRPSGAKARPLGPLNSLPTSFSSPSFKTHRYHVSAFGLRAALFLSRSYLRLLRPGLAELTTEKHACPTPIGKAIERFDVAIQRAWTHQSIAV